MAMTICSWAYLTVLGANGIEKILDIELTAEEKTALDKTANSVRNVIKVVTG